MAVLPNDLCENYVGSSIEIFNVRGVRRSYPGGLAIGWEGEGRGDKVRLAFSL